MSLCIFIFTYMYSMYVYTYMYIIAPVTNCIYKLYKCIFAAFFMLYNFLLYNY